MGAMDGQLRITGGGGNVWADFTNAMSCNAFGSPNGLETLPCTHAPPTKHLNKLAADRTPAFFFLTSTPLHQSDTSGGTCTFELSQ